MSVFNPELLHDEASLARGSEEAAVLAWLATENRTPCLRDVALAVALGLALTLVFSVAG